MATKSGDRTDYWPAIEKKHGLPMSHWFDVMDELSDRKYDEQMSFLREEHGFSQAHANVLIMYMRGSTSSKRFASVDDYLATMEDDKRATVSDILKVLTDAYPGAETVMAWNKPMVRVKGEYVFGVDVASSHILLLPWGDHVIDRFQDRLSGYETNKKTIRVPVGWKPDKKLLKDLVAARVAEFG